MKTDLSTHQTDSKEVLTVKLESQLNRRSSLLKKGLSLRPTKSLLGSKSIKPRTIMPSYLTRKEEEEL